MRKPPATTRPTDAIAREILRVGVGRFVARFSRRYRVDGLPARRAAEVAARELAHEAIAGFLGMPGLRFPGRSAPRKAPSGPKLKIAPPRAQSGGRKRTRKADPEAEWLERLKKYVNGSGPDPTREGDPE